MISIGSIPEKKNLKIKLKMVDRIQEEKIDPITKQTNKKRFRNDFIGNGNVLTLFLVKIDFIIFTVQAKSAGFKPCVFKFFLNEAHPKTLINVKKQFLKDKNSDGISMS